MNKTYCELCGSYSANTEEIAGKSLCQDCWKKYRKEQGLTDAGCINRDVVVCPNREPGYIKALTLADVSSDIIQRELNNAMCYVGHEECRHEKEKISIVQQVIVHHMV